MLHVYIDGGIGESRGSRLSRTTRMTLSLAACAAVVFSSCCLGLLFLLPSHVVLCHVSNVFLVHSQLFKSSAIGSSHTVIHSSLISCETSRFGYINRTDCRVIIE